jgi:hypothetical protein
MQRLLGQLIRTKETGDESENIAGSLEAAGHRLHSAILTWVSNSQPGESNAGNMGLPIMPGRRRFRLSGQPSSPHNHDTVILQSNVHALRNLHQSRFKHDGLLGERKS